MVKTTILKKTLFVILTLFFICSIAFASNNVEIYTNKEYGFRINLPNGWINRESGFPSIIRFKKENAPPSEPLPDLSIGIGPLDPKYNDKSPIDMLSEMGSTSKVAFVEEPREFEQNGLKGARYIVQNNWHRKLTIIFFGRGNIYTILFTARKDTFEQDYKEIENSIKSFELISTKS